MPQSTARFISYDLRPAKQSERKVLIDLLRVAGQSGLPISDYKYIGMGAVRFYDFIQLHKYLGISNMVSLEHDNKVWKRANFNKPYKFIDVLNTSTRDFLEEYQADSSVIFWLDYDGGIGPHITRDIATLAPKLRTGDFLFVTTYGGPPRVIDGDNARGRSAWLQQELGNLVGSLSVEDVENSRFPNVTHTVLFNALKNAFAPRAEGNFLPLLQISYRDSTSMVTVGGAFLAPGQGVEVKEKLERAIPFLATEAKQLYDIRSLNLTEQERCLFDLAVTASRKNCSERNKLKKIGFRDIEIQAYSELIRYLPRYVETII